VLPKQVNSFWDEKAVFYLYLVMVMNPFYLQIAFTYTSV
jgi:hypothetical protein